MEAVGRPVKWLHPGLQLLPGLSDGDELLSSFRITSQEQLTPLVDTGWVPRPERSIPDGLFHSLPTKKKKPCIISPILQMRKLRLREVT